jgi:hypothetical protein
MLIQQYIMLIIYAKQIAAFKHGLGDMVILPQYFSEDAWKCSNVMQAKLKAKLTTRYASGARDGPYKSFCEQSAVSGRNYVQKYVI